MESHTRRKARCPPVFRNPVWKLKCKQDQIKLRHKLQRQLSNDFLRLYEDSNLVDLQLKTHEKDVLCHSFIIESRCISLWSLVVQLSHLQKKRKKSAGQHLTISLPSVDHFSLDSFIRSLYTDEINEELWLSLKPQIEACFPAPNPVRKPLVIESLDTREEKQLERLIADQINKGQFTLKKSGIKTLSSLFVDFGEWFSPSRDVAQGSGEAVSRHPTAVHRGEGVRVMSGHRGIADMTGEQDLKCEELALPTSSTSGPNPEGKTSEGKLRGSKRQSKRSSTQSDERAERHRTEALNEDNLCTHNAFDDGFAFQDTSSLEVELESSNDGRISSPEANACESSSVSTDEPAIISSMTRTKTFEVITPLTRSSCFSAGNSDSGDQRGDLSKDVERRKGSLIFDNNFQTYSSIPSANMMTFAGLPPENEVTGLEDSLSGNSRRSRRGCADKMSGLAAVSAGPESSRKGKMATYRDVDSPSPDSLCVDDSRLKEDYDSEEKERDDSESFPVDLPSNAASIAELPAPPDEEVSENDELTPRCDIRPEVRRQKANGGFGIRDVDAIPVIGSREVEPIETDDRGEPPKDRASNGQSIFSMFIDLNEIPSPKKEAKPRKSLKSQSGVYMFIDAGNASSPTGRRKSKEERVETEIKDTPTAIKPTPGIKLDNGDVRPSVDPVPDSTSSCKRAMVKTISKDPPNKGYYMFIEADSNSSSPKPRRRLSSQNQPSNKENFMSKSAPTDSHLFKGTHGSSSKSLTPNNTLKMMTKSVIDRDEFMSQPPARRNVSLNEKINETSRIPRPVANFRQRLKTRSRAKRASSKETSKDDLAFLDELNQQVESEYDELNRVNGISISEDVSSVSDVSSLLNSIDRSSGRRDSRTLGDDLLRMFEKEINTDVTIQVGERKIRAHKCILASRCVYFAAMLSGHWVESAGNIIKLQGFSPEAVVVAVKHIYSGKSTVPPGVKAIELAALSDMLCLDGLKEVVALHLKANQCHYFHKPCADCLIGVLDVLPIAGAYLLDDLFRRCLKWISKHFTLVLPTRGFATLPSELQDRCIKQIIDEVSVSSAIDTAMGCERVLCLLPAVKWAHGIIDLSSHLFQMVKTFIASNFSNVLSSDRFLSMNTDLHWSIDKMEETLLSCCSQLKLDEAVSTYIKLSSTLDSRDDEGMISFSDMFVDMLKSLLDRTEKMMMDNANRVSVCRKWPLLAPEMQRKIKESSMILLETGKLLSAKPKLSSINRVRGNSMEPVVRARASSMSDSKLNRSASSTVVPSQKAVDGRKLKATSERCQTPPAPLMRHCLQTPLANKTSTLRAQAAIQRSQSAKCVPERNKKKFSNANIEDKHNMNSKDATNSSYSDRSRPSTRINAISTGQTQFGGSRPLTPHRQLMCHKRNYSGSQLTHVQKNFETQDNFGPKRQTPGSGALSNHNVSVIPKPIRTQLPVIQKQTVMSSSANESQLKYFNSEDSDRSYENVTPPIFPPSLPRSSTFSKD